MPAEQAPFETLDLSERLRFVMMAYKLTVAELAQAAGVSKSAMEKYLAGPSSPRATAIASLCAGLGINSEWLLFGQADDDLRRVRDVGIHAIVALLQELKQPGSLSEAFSAAQLGTEKWRYFVLEVGTERAQELSKMVAEKRAKELKMAVGGMRSTPLGSFPLSLVSDGDFASNT